MRRIMTTVAALAIGAASCGCDWADVLNGLMLLDGGGFIYFDNQNDRGDCDEWYDFADPDC